ncbi:MAG: nicotinate-nucleotide adenylyltransferase [Dehalococcoidia bacterium]|nr:nicotinate-nucleotide adenylyltransferase [Dehalococcoidia bacterium]
MNIGILGGTFDPVHIGHLIIAEEARVKLGLGEILFVPAGQPWFKVGQGYTIAPVSHRLEMLRLAIAGNPYFKLCTLEVERSGHSYSIDTVTTLRSQLGEQPLFFILGSDSLAGFHLWKEPDKLVQMCQLVVVPRVGLNLPDLEFLEPLVPGLAHSVIKLIAPTIEVSSSKIRQRIAQGLSVRYLIPSLVEKYIAEHNLYANCET